MFDLMTKKQWCFQDNRTLSMSADCNHDLLEPIAYFDLDHVARVEGWGVIGGVEKLNLHFNDGEVLMLGGSAEEILCLKMAVTDRGRVLDADARVRSDRELSSQEIMSIASWRIDNARSRSERELSPQEIMSIVSWRIDNARERAGVWLAYTLFALTILGLPWVFFDWGNPIYIGISTISAISFCLAVLVFIKVTSTKSLLQSEFSPAERELLNRGCSSGVACTGDAAPTDVA